MTRRATLAVAAFLGLETVLAGVSAPSLWGVNLLAYYPKPVAALFGTLALLLVLPPTRRAGIRLLAGATAGFRIVPERWRFPAEALLAGAVSLALFTGFRSAAHLLGDGALYLRELAVDLWQAESRTGRAPLTIFLISGLHDLLRPVTSDPPTTYRVFSIGSGILYLGLALVAARRLAPSPAGRAVLFALLATPGFMQMFFGYVENYAIHLAVLLLYLLVGENDLRLRRAPWRSALVLAVLVPLHVVFLTLLPSLMVLALLASPVERPIRDPRSWLRAVGLAAAAVAGAGIVLAAIGVPPRIFLTREQASHFLPVFATPNFRQPYRLASWPHVLDLVNLVLLVAPGAVLAAVALGRDAFRPDRRTVFPAAAAVGMGAFVIVANPEIGVFRDWDVLALAGVPLVLTVALLFVKRLDRGRLVQAGFLVAGAALMHTALWVGVNASESRAERRFRAEMENASLSGHARSYGWETLASFDQAAGRTEAAYVAYMRAIRAAPRNPRLRVALGVAYLESGSPAAALQCFREALDLDPDQSETYNKIGLAEVRLGDSDGALRDFTRAVDLDPENPDAQLNLGNMVLSLGRTAEAERSYLRVLQINPQSPEGHANLATALYAQGRYDEAIAHAQEAARLQPTLWNAVYTLGASYWAKNDPVRAREYFERFLAGDPGNANANAVRQALGR